MPTLLRFSLLLLVAASATAQDARPLAVGEAQRGTASDGVADRYTLDLDASQFVSGVADQESADVVVTVTAPDGATVTEADGTARGAEPFQFETASAGTYTVTVAPFDDAVGDYTLTIRRAEPIATTPSGRIDQAMARFDGRPGALVAVVEGGEVVFERAYGMANLTHGIPMTLDTKTNIGSTSKQFTAMALVLLDQRGDLDLG